MWRRQRWCWLVVLIPWGCGGRSDGAGGESGPRCEPGRQISCACPKGARAVQVCGDDFRYEPCQCSANGSGGSVAVSGPGGTSAIGKGGTGGTTPVGSAGQDSGSGGTSSLPIDYHYGEVAPCDTEGSSLFFDGDGGDYIHPGQDLLTVARFSDSSSPAHISFHIEPSGEEHGLWWTVDMSSEELGEPLAEGEYLGAERYPFQTYLKAGLDVSGDGRGCNRLSGKFLITDIVWRGGTLITFTAAFEQHCEQGDAALRGCVHYDSGYDLGEGGEGGVPSEGGASGATDSEGAG